MVGNDVIVYYSCSSALSSTVQGSTNFPQTLGPRNQVASLRVGHQRQLELDYIVFSKQTGG